MVFTAEPPSSSSSNPSFFPLRSHRFPFCFSFYISQIEGRLSQSTSIQLTDAGLRSGSTNLEMARVVLFRLVRSQASHHHPTSTNFPFLSVSGYNPCKFGTRSHLQSANNILNSSAQFPVAQKRWASQSSAAEDHNKFGIAPHRGGEPKDDDKDTSGIVYYGPISNTLKHVKLLSLSTCCLSVSLGPVITFMTSTDTNVILKGAVASSVIFFSASTTAALHWFVSPYIHKLRWQPGSDSFEVEMMSWLATFVLKTIKFADIRMPETNRPYVTFKANA
ncbi:uncharacterized protein LOC131318737 isoform X2 [Rhododendron vialii]|uniref:uncharacterized protein LOC131318737 isoform X2 n=2 Tax=Rhododendron vialii TaxID=182163 RepID=UPI00265F6116|nr:uncharacterized protein LOC131318737 isoform X2 [Rhododendron vialii]